MNKDKHHLELLKYLSEFVTANKKDKIEHVLSERTRAFTVVLEDLFKPHNASAVLRTCECYGVQDVHIVEQNHQYSVNPYVTRGAAKWMTLHRYDDPEASNVANCFEALKDKGYRILATSVDPQATKLQDVEVTGKMALVFGTEFDGITKYVKTHADELVYIPMLGFTDSFNISVSAAIALERLMPEVRKLRDWRLEEEEKEDLRLNWYQIIVKNADIHVKKFNEDLKAKS